MKQDLTVIYNDTCPICSREVAGYKKRTGPDVSYVGLEPDKLDQYGLTADTAARQFHVVTDGKMLSGVAAFAALWERVPGLAWLAGVVRLPVIRQIVEFGYNRIAAPFLFALHRRRVRRGD